MHRLWEGIGVSSFLLIGFWMTRAQAVKSAIKAMTVNRVGDLFLTLGLFMSFTVIGSLDYGVVFANAHWIQGTTSGQGVLVVSTLLMLIGAMAKSAQVPLHTWLAASILKDVKTPYPPLDTPYKSGCDNTPYLTVRDLS